MLSKKLFTTLLSVIIAYSFTQAQNPNNAQTPSKTLKKVERLQDIPAKLRNMPAVRGENEEQKNTKAPKSYLDARLLNQIKIQKELQKQNPDLSYTQAPNNTIQTLFGDHFYNITSNNENELKNNQIKGSLLFLDQIQDLVNIEKPSANLNFRSIYQDPNLKTYHLRFDQIYKGFRVWGSDLAVHFKNETQIYGITGAYHPTLPQINITPSLSIPQAIETAASDLSQKTVIRELSPETQTILDYYGPKVEWVVFPTPHLDVPYTLACHIVIRPNILDTWEYLVHAQTGEILRKWNSTCSAGPTTENATDLSGKSVRINTYEFNGRFYLLDASRPMFNASKSKIPSNPIGALVTYTAENTQLDKLNYITKTTTWNNPKAVSAHNNAAITYEYYANIHQRNAIDGNGSTIISVVDVTNSDGSKMDNAFWNGKMMAYGDGDQCFRPLAGALDVAAHEMTHGVISNSANLEYEGQPGALNESFADVFGVCVDKDDWQLGEDVSRTSCFATGCLRDIKNPHNGGNSINDHSWQPQKMSEFQDIDHDHGGVHINSGIPNHAFYLIASQIGIPKAEKIYYRTLTSYLTRSSKFIDLRLSVVQAAKDLYGDNASEINIIKKAFDTVEIFDGTGGGHTNEIPPVVGTDYILVHAMDGASKGIYLYNMESKNLSALTSYFANRRASVTDNGSFAYYVEKNSKDIKAVRISENSPQDFEVTSDGYWENVAISRDGRKLACITNRSDSSIYVYNYDIKQWKRFILYHPSFTSGVKGGNPRHADVIEWDPSGEHIIYDAYTQIDNSGIQYDYWDVGIINVWNNNANTFATGTVEKLFSSLPEDISVGNPTYAKNSPYIISFDYIDSSNESKDEYTMLGVNIETQKANNILSTQILSYPSYSGKDDKICFNNRPSEETTVYTLDIKADKISANSTPQFVLRNAKWPQWFTVGSRPVSTEQLQQPLSSQIVIFPNPSEDGFTLTAPTQQALFNEPLTVEVFGIMGNKIASYTWSDTSQNLMISTQNWSAGVYFAKFLNKENKITGISKMILNK